MLVAIASFSTAALAHHSAAQFDFAQTVRIEGVVKEMRVANPHIALFLEVTDGKGTRVIEYEGHSRNNVYRRGWRPEMVHTGDTISIDIAPMRTGEDGGYVKTFITEGRHRVLELDESRGARRSARLRAASAPFLARVIVRVEAAARISGAGFQRSDVR